MRQRILSRSLEAILERPVVVLGATVALCAVALWLGSGVELTTSRRDLAPQGDPDQARFERLTERAGGFSTLIVAVRAEPGTEPSTDRLRAFADALARDLSRDPLVARVFHKVDPAWFLDRILWYVPPDALIAAAQALDEEPELLAALERARGLADLNDAIAARMRRGLTSGATAPDEGTALSTIDALARVLRLQRRFLEDPGALAPFDPAGPDHPLLGAASLVAPEAAGGGYLASHDGLTLYLLASPAKDDDSLPALRALIAAASRTAEATRSAHPGFRVVLTGEPATTVEEMDTVGRDTLLTSSIAGAGVVLLTLLIFRWSSHAALVLAALAAGVIWSWGAVRLELGYLNLITSSFISTLVGVGVAYGIHPVSEYELEGAHTSDPVEAARAAFRRTGAAITVSAVTTAGAFFSILFMRFRGFAELGLVAGVGVLLCLTAALTTLPALLVIAGRIRTARGHKEMAVSPLVDRLWLDQASGWICAFPRGVTVIALAVTVALGWSATKVGFDHDILELLPGGADSVAEQRRMIEGSDLSPEFAVAEAADLAALREMRAHALAEPAITRFESALRFLPEDPDGSLRAIDLLRDRLDRLAAPPLDGAADRAAIGLSLARLEGILEDSAEAAFAGGSAALAPALLEAAAAAGEARETAVTAPPGTEAEWTAGQELLRAWADAALVALRAAAVTRSPELEDLPEPLRERFVTSDGALLALLYPSGKIFDPAFLERFVAACRSVAENSTGFPILFHKMSRRITGGFTFAVSVGAGLVVLILLADYRNLRETALALLPLAVGIVWMLGGMQLLGLSFNFANLIAVPLVIGVGIDNGVHVIHRMRLEGRDGMTIVLRHTGRAILMAGLTTMIGLGSLSFASHRGLASLGLALIVGVGSCMITSLVVLPNLLVAFGLARR